MAKNTNRQKIIIDFLLIRPQIYIRNDFKLMTTGWWIIDDSWARTVMLTSRVAFCCIDHGWLTVNHWLYQFFKEKETFSWLKIRNLNFDKKFTDLRTIIQKIFLVNLNQKRDPVLTNYLNQESDVSRAMLSVGVIDLSIRTTI